MVETKILAIFTSSGLAHRGAWDAVDIAQKVMSNAEMLDEVACVCGDGVTFEHVDLVDEERLDMISRSYYGLTPEELDNRANVFRLARERAAAVVEKIRRSPGDVDGILIFGAPWRELIDTGLPIVAVFPMWGTWMAEFDFLGYRDKKVVTSCLPVVRDLSEAVFRARINDIATKIRMIQTISNMEALRILDITDRPVLGSYERGWGDLKAYEATFLENVRQVFGSDIVTIPQSELFDEIWAVSETEAQRVAGMWLEGAVGIEGTVKAEVVKSARVYLAMRVLMEKYDCGAITTEGYGVFADYEQGAIPSQGLAASQLYTDGITATSECLLNSLLTQHLGLHILGRPGFNGDYIIDPFNHIAVVGHCEGAFNPYGDERRSPYVIRNLPRWHQNEGGACVQINYPVGETVTLAKLSMVERKLALSTGKTVSGHDYFADWDDLACRTKIAVETDTEVLLSNLDWRTFGTHRVVFFGDFRQTLKDLARLIGFEVVEEDR